MSEPLEPPPGLPYEDELTDELKQYCTFYEGRYWMWNLSFSAGVDDVWFPIPRRGDNAKAQG